MDNDKVETSNHTTNWGTSGTEAQAQPQTVSPTTRVRDKKHVHEKPVQPIMDVESKETRKNILQTLQDTFNVIYNHGTLDQIDRSRGFTAGFQYFMYLPDY